MKDCKTPRMDALNSTLRERCRSWLEQVAELTPAHPIEALTTNLMKFVEAELKLLLGVDEPLAQPGQAAQNPDELSPGDASYLEAVLVGTFDPIGQLYSAIFSGLHARGLVRRVGRSAFTISDRGKQLLAAYKEKKRAGY